MPILILGGTAEARELAAALVQVGHEVVSSLAGRVREPVLPLGRVRVGGFGGIDGLASYLRSGRVYAVVDATHPFAAQISENAVTAAQRTGIPLIRLERQGWTDHPLAGTWRWVSDAAGAQAAGQHAARPFVTSGRQSLETFLTWLDRPVLARLVEPPDQPLPANWTVLTSRGPYSYTGERAIMIDYAIDLLITKDSGGSHTAAKLDVAHDLGIDVVIIARPPPPDAPRVATVEEAMTWCAGARPRRAAAAPPTS